MKFHEFIRIAAIAAIFVSTTLQCVADEVVRLPDGVSAGVLIHESLIRQIITEQRHQQESIAKIILGANVEGCQTTITDVTANVVRDDHRIRIDLVNNGQVTSRTRSRNAQAAIDSTGQHQFTITKPFFYDGEMLLTQHCYGTIHASQTPVRVFSSASTMPLLGPVADQVAWSEVLRRSPEIDRALAEDLSTDILPKIDRSSDPELALLGRELRRVNMAARSWLGTVPDRIIAYSTDDTAILWLAHDTTNNPTPAGPREFDTSPAAAAIRNEEALVFLISEQLATQLVRQHLPTGLKVTDLQLNSLLAGFESDPTWTLDELLQKFAAALPQESPDPLAEPAVGVYSLEFPKRDSVQILFRDGEVLVRSTLQVVPRFGPASGWQIVETRLRGIPQDQDHWSPVVAGISVLDATPTKPVDAVSGSSDTPYSIASPAGSPAEPAVTVTAGTAWTQLIQSTTAAIAEKLPVVQLPRVVNLETINPGLAATRSSQSPLPGLRLHRIRAENGVLRISFQTDNKSLVP